MTREHWETELRRWIWQEPFRPFVVELKSGERVLAVDPDAVGFGGGNAGIIQPGGIPVSFRITDIIRIEASDAATAHAS